MTRAGTRAWVRSRRDEGMSMAELSVSLVVFSVLIVATLLVTLQVQQLYVRDTASEDAMQGARHAMDVVVRDLQSVAFDQISDAFTAAPTETTGTAVTFSVVGSAGLVRERIWVDAQGVLWRQTTQPDTSSVAPNYTYVTNRGQVTERLATRVSAATGSTPVFGYVIAGAVSTNVTTTAQQTAITAFVVTLTVTSGAGAATVPVTLTNTAAPLRA